MNNKKNSTSDAKKKFREKMLKYKLSRTKQVLLDKEAEILEAKLKKKKLPTKEKKKLRKRLNLIEQVEEDRYNSINDEYPEYPEN